MAFSRIILLVVLSIAYLQFSQAATGIESKVTGGNTAYQGQFPYQVRLFIATKTGASYLCGASIISPHIVLSAADCFYGLNLYYVQVIAGNIYTSVGFAGQQVSYVSTVYLHSAYNPYYFTNDLAILLLYTPLQYTAYVQPIPLPAATATFADNMACTIAGFGKATYGGPLATTLQYATVSLVNLQSCASIMSRYGMPMYTSQICTSSVVKAACNGDGGGPVVCRGVSRSGVVTNVVAGIMSYGVNCNSGVPQVNTRVSVFSDLVNLYAATFKDAVVGASATNCTDGDVDCYPKISNVVDLRDSNSTTDSTTASTVVNGNSKSGAMPTVKALKFFAPIVTFAVALLVLGKRE